MLHVKVFKGLVPANLVMDRDGRIPLPGDDVSVFNFAWPTTARGIVPHEQKLKLLGEWQMTNVQVVKRHMKFVARNRKALQLFEQECDQERDKKLATYNPIYMKKSLKYILEKVVPDAPEENDVEEDREAEEAR